MDIYAQEFRENLVHKQHLLSKPEIEWILLAFLHKPQYFFRFNSIILSHCNYWNTFKTMKCICEVKNKRKILKNLQNSEFFFGATFKFRLTQPFQRSFGISSKTSWDFLSQIKTVFSANFSFENCIHTWKKESRSFKDYDKLLHQIFTAVCTTFRMSHQKTVSKVSIQMTFFQNSFSNNSFEMQFALEKEEKLCKSILNDWEVFFDGNSRRVEY